MTSRVLLEGHFDSVRYCWVHVQHYSKILALPGTSLLQLFHWRYPAGNYLYGYRCIRGESYCNKKIKIVLRVLLIKLISHLSGIYYVKFIVCLLISLVNLLSIQKLPLTQLINNLVAENYIARESESNRLRQWLRWLQIFRKYRSALNCILFKRSKMLVIPN